MGLDELTRKIKEICALNIPLRRSLVKYTPGWGRSYIPSTQKKRELIAEYKQIPNPQLIEDKKIILVDDSIRRGTQLKDLLRDKVWPFKPKEIHGRIASPPQLYPCIFDLSTKRRDLATCRALGKIQEEKSATEYGDSKGMGGDEMIEEMRKMIGCTTLKFITLENMIKAVIEAPNNKGLKRKDLCLYCWTGKF